jgi:peptidoglycan hydrolase-like protein with peptidoglycan-binding domain
MVVARTTSARAVAPAVVAAAGLAVLLAMSACTSSTSSSGEADAATRPPTTPAITEPAPTTVAPTTTARPSTTVRRTTTTTAAPTTTEARRPAPSRPTQRPRPRPERPAPANIVPIAPLDVPLAAVGSSGGSETARLQQRLLDLGFWLSGADGVYGLTTRQAVMAFQKYLQLPATGEVDDATAGYLSGLTERARGWADAGTLVEVDKTRQLLFVVVDGKTQWVFNTSTGNGERYVEPDKNTPGEMIDDIALTPDGLHAFYREKAEGWWEGDLGQLYRPKYFVGGVAVHGSNSVPNYPASHGCVRVTTEAMDFIWDSGIMPMGLPVLVHQESVA